VRTDFQISFPEATKCLTRLGTGPYAAWRPPRLRPSLLTLAVPSELPEFRTTFGLYVAVAVIGEGGAGTVYRAEDEESHAVAIKLLDPAKSTRERVKRFKNELSFGLNNTHPNILTVHDHGFAMVSGAPAPFYVMPLYEGSVRKLLSTPVDPTRLRLYVDQLLDGLEAAHLSGIVHRDVKPENLLWDKSADQLVLADFGIARFAQEMLLTAVETNSQARLANFQYAAPEQRRRGGTVDQRADLYAAGLIMNEMATLEVPQGTAYRPIQDVYPELAYMDVIVERMIRQNPAERYSSVDEIKLDLIRAGQEQTIRQRLNESRSAVIPTTEIDDPLVLDPPRLVAADWDYNQLSLSLSRPVNEAWHWALHNVGSFSALPGREPDKFTFNGKVARIQATEYEAQQIVDHFKDWLPRANANYALEVRRKRERDEAGLRARLKKRQELLERRERVLKNLKI